MCAGAIGLSGIKQVYFGAENDKFGGNGSILNLHEYYGYKSEGGHMAERAVKLL